jgi:hypothetical protein
MSEADCYYKPRDPIMKFFAEGRGGNAHNPFNISREALRKTSPLKKELRH